MSYDIYIKCPCCKQTLHTEEPHQLAGGTYALGGTTEAHLNITYNYGKHYYNVFGEGGIRSLYGKKAADTVAMIEEAASKLGTDEVDDYWKPTEGNARKALLDLAALAKMFPKGVWDGD